MGISAAVFLADGLKHCENLKTLNLDRNYLGSEGSSSLARSLKHCGNLESLSLGQNQIGDDGAFQISEIFGESSSTESQW